MKVCVYLPDYNEKHCDVLTAFAKGVPGGAIMRPLGQYEPSDVAVIFGLVKNSYAPTHAKRRIIANHQGRSLIVIESAFCLRGQYYAVGFGGIHGAADFRNRGMPSDRWRQIGIKTKPWKRRPDGPVVVCGQLPRDTNVQDVDHVAWVKKAFKYYRKDGTPVLFRPHPRIDDAAIYGVPFDFHDTRKLKKTLFDARCVVTWNSTTGIDALIAGVPVIAQSPNSMARPMASCSLDLSKLRFPSRRQFFADLGYTQWTLDELREGAAWRHLMRA